MDTLTLLMFARSGKVDLVQGLGVSRCPSSRRTIPSHPREGLSATLASQLQASTTTFTPFPGAPRVHWSSYVSSTGKLSPARSDFLHPGCRHGHIRETLPNVVQRRPYGHRVGPRHVGLDYTLTFSVTGGAHEGGLYDRDLSGFSISQRL